MFTGPICSRRTRSPRQVSSSAASSSPSEPSNFGVGAQHMSLNVDLGKAACLKMLKIGIELGQLARKPGAVLA